VTLTSCVHLGSVSAQEYGLATEEEIRRVAKEEMTVFFIGEKEGDSRSIFIEPQYRPERSDGSILVECTERRSKACYYMGKFYEAFFRQDDAIDHYEIACQQGMVIACEDKERLSNVDMDQLRESYEFLTAYEERQGKKLKRYAAGEFSGDASDPFFSNHNFRKFSKFASNGDPYAAVIVGAIYQQTAYQRSSYRREVTTGVKEKNHQKLISKASKYFESACKNRVASGCSSLGQLYSNGSYGHEVDYGKSIRLFRKACLIKGIMCGIVQHEERNIQIIEKQMSKYYDEGNYVSAIDAANDLLEVQQALWGKDDPMVAQTLYNISEFHRKSGRPDLAEEKSFEAYHIWKSYGLNENYLISQAYDGMAVIEIEKQNFNEAKNFLQKSVEIKEMFLEADPIQLAGTLSNLGVVYFSDNQTKRAEGNFLRALNLLSHKPTEHAVALSTIYGNLALVHAEKQEFKQARRKFELSISIVKEHAFESHPNLANLYAMLGELEQAMGLSNKAEQHLLAGLNVANLNFGDNHPQVIKSNVSLADFYLQLEKPDKVKAHYFYSQAIEGIDQRLIFQNNGSAWLRRSLEAERAIYSEVYAKHALVSALLSLRLEDPDEDLFVEAFDSSQRSLNSTAGRALGQSTARLKSNKRVTGQNLRERQDSEVEWHKILTSYKSSIAFDRTVATDNSKPNYLEMLESVEEKILDLDSKLKFDFPHHYNFTSPDPLSVQEIQDLLKREEALILIAVVDIGTLVFAISEEEVAFSVVKMDSDSLAESVRVIRTSLENPDSSYPLRQAHGVYQSLFGGIESVFEDKDQILIVSSGALSSIPMGALVIEEPTVLTSSVKNLRSTKWWGTEQALAVLPSVSSLRALREEKLRKPGNKPFAGFGNPVLGEEESVDAKNSSSRGTSAFFRDQFADVSALKSLGDLPATKGELVALAKALGSEPKKSLWLGSNNTEANIKGLDLSNREVIAFATHALMSGEISGYAEPGLVFTPPLVVSDFEDGFLTTTEISKLKLNADWVILSACNTAAADELGAEGLSGLARSFFYAGARSILASHWQVSDKATAQLTTQTILFKKADPNLSKAEALRLSMASLINDVSNSKYAHPYYWSPFILVGDGY